MAADPHIDTLLHPIRPGSVGEGLVPANVLCIGLAAPLPNDALAGSDCTYVQGFRPAFLALQRAGCRVTPTVPDKEAFEAVLVRLGRHRGQNEAWIAAALRLVRTGGLVVAAGGKTDGAASLRKRIVKLGLAAEHKSLNHGVVFWLKADGDCKAPAAVLAPASNTLVDGQYLTASGMFSHGKIDAGSHLLADCLGTGISGDVADFCAGWGYLSARLLKGANDIGRLDLFEADLASIEAAKLNTADTGDTKVTHLWLDLEDEPVEHRYDVIVMNPPFHIGRKAEPDLGLRIIDIAGNALANRGRLLMVANRQLPYENALNARFGSVELLTEDNRYKVFSARK